MYLRQFLQQLTHPPEHAPSGLTDLDTRLAGGFGPGLHVIAGGPGVGKTAFLEAVAWEAVLSDRPVLYYTLKEGSLGAWERLVSALGNILGGPVLTLDALRNHKLGSEDLETLHHLDGVLQASVLPYLSLIETIPAAADTSGAFIEDVRLRAQEAKELWGRTPLLLVDDLERLLLLTRPRRPRSLLSLLDETLVGDSVPGLLGVFLPEWSVHGPETIPAQTTVTLLVDPASVHQTVGRVDLEVRANARTGWTGKVPLLLDRGSGMFARP